MMRSVVLTPVFAVMFGAAAASAQYDFYEFMNSAGYAPGPSVSSQHSPSTRSTTELVSLDDLEIVQPGPTAQQFTQAPHPATVALPAAAVGPDASIVGSTSPPLEYGCSVPPASLVGPELVCPDGRCAHRAHRGGHHHGHAEIMPYRQPILPPPASLYGYFNSPPAYAHLWDTYPQEAAARAAWLHHATRPYQPRQGVRGELVEPCH